MSPLSGGGSDDSWNARKCAVSADSAAAKSERGVTPISAAKRSARLRMPGSSGGTSLASAFTAA